MDYNKVRPHSSLMYLTPEEFAASAVARPASPPTPVVLITLARKGSDVQDPPKCQLMTGPKTGGRSFRSQTREKNLRHG